MEITDPFIYAYLLVVAGLLGLVMGSFINCWAWRSTHGESVMEGRSHCATCNHVLGVRDLIPVISWLASGGKCRYCGQKVSARYPITELICATVFVAITAKYGYSLETLELLAFSCVLLFLSLTDIDEFIIPNGCIIAALAIRVVYLAVSCVLGSIDLGQVLYFLASAFGVGIALLVVVLVADRVFGRESMGGGDLKLYFVAAFYFGWQQSVFLIIVSCVIGIIVSLVGAGMTGSVDEGAPDVARDGLPAGDDGDAGVAAPVAIAGDVDGVVVEGDNAAVPVSADGNALNVGNANAESVLKRVIPFGPSIAAACIITMLAGNSFITWYISLI